jgi:hypothetical protein
MLSDPVSLPVLLMLIVAPLGGIDAVYFHLWKQRLYDLPSARKEMITHLFRDFLFGLGALIIFNFEPGGAWFWITGALFAFDFVNSIADVLLETESRAPLGGIPPVEYLVHTIGSTFSGAIMATYFVLGWRLQFLPTQLETRAGVPELVRWSGYLVVMSGMALTALEGFLFARSIRRSASKLA